MTRCYCLDPRSNRRRRDLLLLMVAPLVRSFQQPVPGSATKTGKPLRPSESRAAGWLQPRRDLIHDPNPDRRYMTPNRIDT